MIIPFVGDAYKTRSPNLNCQTCINLYPVIDQKGGKAPTALYRTEGLTLFSDDDDLNYVTRGTFEENGILYAVIDNKFYTIDTAGTRTLRGTLLTSVGIIDMQSNGLQICIVDGDNQYVYTQSTQVFTTNPSANFLGSYTIAYQDGYGIFFKPNTTTFYITDLFDFSILNALDFDQADTSPDNLITGISKSQELWLIKRNSAEVWYDTGNLDFPLQRRQTLVFRYGIAAQYSLVRVDNTYLVWLGRNEHSQTVVVAIEGYSAKIISNDAINYIFSTYTTVDDAQAFVYEKDGHLMYVLTFPTEDRTWVYDLTTEMWHERRSQINNQEPFISPTRQGRWRPNTYAFFNNKHIVGDFESGKLFYLDDNNYTENGTPITWERTTYHLSQDEKYLFIDNLQIVVQSGVGLNDGQGSDPQMMLQVSKDMGHTFSAERWRSMGKQGQYKKRVQWTALGGSRDWVFRARGTDPVNTVILSARANVNEAEY
jgi:hypothetical protein